MKKKTCFHKLQTYIKRHQFTSSMYKLCTKIICLYYGTQLQPTHLLLLLLFEWKEKVKNCFHKFWNTLDAIRSLQACTNYVQKTYAFIRAPNSGLPVYFIIFIIIIIIYLSDSTTLQMKASINSYAFRELLVSAFVLIILHT